MEINSGDVPATNFRNIEKLCTDKCINDPGLVFDVYRVISMKGVTKFISDDDLLKEYNKLDPKYWTARVQFNKRKDFIEHLSSSKYMQALIDMDDPMKAVIVFVEHLEKAQAAIEQFKQKRKAISGRQRNMYKGGITDDELDAMRDGLIAARNKEETFDDYLEKLTRYDEVCESEELESFYSGAGFCSSYNATNYGGSLAKSVVDSARSLPLGFQIFYNEFTRISKDIGSSNTKDSISAEEQNKKKKDRMTEYSQVDSVDPTELARENFDVNLAEKKVEVNHNIEPEKGTCHVMVLLDVSVSMQGCDLGGRVGRDFAANVVTMSLLQFAQKDGWKVHLATFAGNVNRGSVQHAIDKDSTIKAMNWLGGQDYNGYGTDIEGAVLWAYESLKIDPDYRKCDIVLITDGVSSIGNEIISMKPPRTKLRTLFVTGHISSCENTKRIIKASDSYKLVEFDNMTGQFDLGDALAAIGKRESNDNDKGGSDA